MRRTLTATLAAMLVAVLLPCPRSRRRRSCRAGRDTVPVDGSLTVTCSQATTPAAAPAFEVVTCPTIGRSAPSTTSRARRGR